MKRIALQFFSLCLVLLACILFTGCAGMSPGVAAALGTAAVMELARAFTLRSAGVTAPRSCWAARATAQ